MSARNISVTLYADASRFVAAMKRISDVFNPFAAIELITHLRSLNVTECPGRHETFPCAYCGAAI